MKTVQKILSGTLVIISLVGQPATALAVQKVPFVSQAPLGRWSDPRQQNGCEEASVLMAMAWVREKNLSKKQAEGDSIAISKFEEKKFGSSTDTSAKHTAQRILGEYFKYDRWTLASLASPENIIKELNKGKIAIVPVNGRALKNPYYKPPGPRYHMLVVIGYDPATQQFITNDPGTRRGAGYRYGKNLFFRAIRDYPSGEHRPLVQIKKRAIFIEK